MNLEILFRIGLYAIFFSFAAVMTAYSKRSKSRQGSVADRIRAHHEHEVPVLLKIRAAFGIPFYVGLMVWTFAPRTMEWSSLALPVWARWAGLALGLSAVALNVWSHRTLSRRLGPDFDPVLRLVQVPALVREGPYGRVRHPIYLAFLLMQLSVLLITANWLIGLLGLAIIAAVIAIRVPEEERLLSEQFGNGYLAYMAQTGRLLPKIQ